MNFGSRNGKSSPLILLRNRAAIKPYCPESIFPDSLRFARMLCDVSLTVSTSAPQKRSISLILIRIMTISKGTA